MFIFIKIFIKIYIMSSVIIYTYFQSISSDYNLYYFINNEITYKKNIDYIIIINGYDYNKYILFPTLPNLTVLFRENIGYDFGGHNHALNYLLINKKYYNYYFFMNSSVIGPIIIKPTQHWTKIFINKINNNVKLVGTTIVCLPRNDAGGFGPKVEGFFFMTDSIGLKLLQQAKTIFCNHTNKKNAIVNGEYGLSNCIFKNGYTIDCMLNKYKNIDWTNPKNYYLNKNLHPSRKNSFYNESINPYEVIFHKWYWHNERFVNFDIVNRFVKKNMLYSQFYKDIYFNILKLSIQTKSYDLNHIKFIEKDVLLNIKIELLKNPNMKLNIIPIKKIDISNDNQTVKPIVKVNVKPPNKNKHPNKLKKLIMR